MSTTFYVWNPILPNVGHAAVKIGDTYMSWWPASGSKMEMYKGIFGSGSLISTPSLKDDIDSERKVPDYIGDHFGWDDQIAIRYWTSQLPTYAAAGAEIIRAGSASKYQFFTCNCATMITQILRAAGAFENDLVLNAWLGVKSTFAFSPPDITRISQYFAGHKEALLI
jgi:hypothetical protein